MVKYVLPSKSKVEPPKNLFDCFNYCAVSVFFLLLFLEGLSNSSKDNICHFSISSCLFRIGLSSLMACVIWLKNDDTLSVYGVRPDRTDHFLPF